MPSIRRPVAMASIKPLRTRRIKRSRVPQRFRGPTGSKGGEDEDLHGEAQGTAVGQVPLYELPQRKPGQQRPLSSPFDKDPGEPAVPIALHGRKKLASTGAPCLDRRGTTKGRPHAFQGRFPRTVAGAPTWYPSSGTPTLDPACHEPPSAHGRFPACGQRHHHGPDAPGYIWPHPCPSPKPV